jgi:hypothetical protein
VNGDAISILALLAIAEQRIIETKQNIIDEMSNDEGNSSLP